MKVYSLLDLKQIAALLGRSFSGGETIELIGDVGAGKTTFTKAIAHGMGITQTISSPTFTLSNRYVSPNGLILAHYDFYRLSDAGIMGDELIETTNDSNSVTVVEWADIVENVLPSDRLQIHFKPASETTRYIKIHATGECSEMLKEQLHVFVS